MFPSSWKMKCVTLCVTPCMLLYSSLPVPRRTLAMATSSNNDTPAAEKRLRGHLDDTVYHGLPDPSKDGRLRFVRSQFCAMIEDRHLEGDIPIGGKLLLQRVALKLSLELGDETAQDIETNNAMYRRLHHLYSANEAEVAALVKGGSKLDPHLYEDLVKANKRVEDLKRQLEHATYDHSRDEDEYKTKIDKLEETVRDLNEDLKDEVRKNAEEVGRAGTLQEAVDKLEKDLADARQESEAQAKRASFLEKKMVEFKMFFLEGKYS